MACGGADLIGWQGPLDVWESWSSSPTGRTSSIGIARHETGIDAHDIESLASWGPCARTSIIFNVSALLSIRKHGWCVGKIENRVGRA